MGVTGVGKRNRKQGFGGDGERDKFRDVSLEKGMHEKSSTEVGPGAFSGGAGVLGGRQGWLGSGGEGFPTEPRILIGKTR